MVDVKNLNRIKGILSARQGAEIPKFQQGAKFAMYNGRQMIYSNDLSSWFNDEALTSAYTGNLGEFQSIQYDPPTPKNPIKPASHLTSSTPVATTIPGNSPITPTTAIENAAREIEKVEEVKSDTEAQKVANESLGVQSNTAGKPVTASSSNVSQNQNGLKTQENDAQTELKNKLVTPLSMVTTLGSVLSANQTASNSQLTNTIDSAYSLASAGISNLGSAGQIVSAGMNALATVGNIGKALVEGSDQMTKTDKWMDSSLLSWNLGLINNAFGKNSDSFSVDSDVVSSVGSSYRGTVNDLNDAAAKAGKKYGLFSQKDRKKANAAIANAGNKQSLMSNISNSAEDQRLAVQSMGEQAGLAYSLMADGGYNQKYTYTAKQGGLLEWNPVVELAWEPQIELNWELPTFKEGGNIDINEELEWIPELKSGDKVNLDEVRKYYKEYDLSNIEFIMDESPRTEGNKLYISNEEDAVHELWHYLSNNQPNEVYKDYYDNLTDDRIIELGGDLQFVKRFENDPGHFYHPSELEARIKAAKFKTRGQTYIKEFFQNLRKDENKYGNNMRDLLHMYSDDNLVKLFNLRSIEELVEYAKQKNPRFIQRLSEEPRGIKFTDDEGNEAEGSHYLESRGEYVIPRIQEIDGELKFLSSQEAIDRAMESGNYLEMTPEEAILFAEKYKQGWPDFFEKFKKGGSLGDSDVPETEETTQKNVIPEGALHKNKHHMEHAEGLTKKGIPVIDDDGDQQAEIEHSEIIFTLEVTKKLEEYYEIFYSDETTNKEKEQAALDAGKLLVYQILENTEDRTGLIESCKKGGSLTLKKSADDLIEEVLEWMPTIVIIEEKEENKSKKDTKEKSEKEKMKEAIKEVLIDLLTS